MNFNLNNSWKNWFLKESKKEYFLALTKKLDSEYKDGICFPAKENILRAFELCDLDTLKVVIVGQDPYHGENQADGLAFSISKTEKLPPSLKNILKELFNNYSESWVKNGDLSIWASQGVLLLNAVLTVKNGIANSHAKIGWEIFTRNAVAEINNNKVGVIFILWGKNAQENIKFIDNTKHYILTSNHPSPLSANRGGWFGNNHFIKTNELLKSQNLIAINW